MRRTAVVLAILFASALPLCAQTAMVTATWNPNPEPDVTGYKLYVGPAPQTYTTVLDIPGHDATSKAVTGLAFGQRAYFALQAYNATLTSAYSTEVFFDVPGTDPCAYPLGAKAVLIFPTGKLEKTGTGGAGTLAAITFRTASPNSPVTFESIRANGVDLPDSIISGSAADTRLQASGKLWFTVPPGPATFTFSIFAKNLAGCVREQLTGFTLAVP